MAKGMNGLTVVGIALLAIAGGCQSPRHADQGALFGGLVGAGTGAIVGEALGDTRAGAAIGAGVGALSGAAVGSGLDQIEAENRAQISSLLGQQIRPGATSIEDVAMMSQAGVDEELIVNHIRANGVTRVPGPHELIQLKQRGVPVGAIRAMQEVGTLPPQAIQPVAYRERPPMFVEERIYAPPCWHGSFHRSHVRRPPRSGISWGLSFHR